MNLPFEIVTRESFQVVAYRFETTNQKKEGMKKIPTYWQTFLKSEQKEILMPHMNQEPFGCFGISEYNIDPQDSRRFAYYIAVSSSDDAQGELVSYTVPKCTWAIISCTKETMGKVQVQAITKWLPKSNYKPSNKGYITGRMKSGAPDIECYLHNDEVSIWIAVQEK